MQLSAFWIIWPFFLETPRAVFPIYWVLDLRVWPLYTIDAQGTTTVFRAVLLHFTPATVTEAISTTLLTEITAFIVDAYMLPTTYFALVPRYLVYTILIHPFLNFCRLYSTFPAICFYLTMNANTPTPAFNTSVLFAFMYTEKVRGAYSTAPFCLAVNASLSDASLFFLKTTIFACFLDSTMFASIYAFKTPTPSFTMFACYFFGIRTSTIFTPPRPAIMRTLSHTFNATRPCLFTMRATSTWLLLGNRMPNTILASAIDKIVYTFLHNWPGNRVSETLGTARPRRFTMCTLCLHSNSAWTFAVF